MLAGILLSLGIQVVEIPPELALATLLPGLGLPIVVGWNGLENIVLPVLLGLAILARKTLVVSQPPRPAVGTA